MAALLRWLGGGACERPVGPEAVEGPCEEDGERSGENREDCELGIQLTKCGRADRSKTML